MLQEPQKSNQLKEQQTQIDLSSHHATEKSESEASEEIE
jgi:hypothetical protein